MTAGRTPSDTRFILTEDTLEEFQNFCIVPWVHLQVDVDGRALPCCRIEATNGLGSLKERNLAEIWNGPELRDMRRQMLRDERLPQCGDCHRVERAGGESYRQDMNRQYRASFADVAHTASDGSVFSAGATSLGLRFSNVCNFRCRTCGPEFSTAWYPEIETLAGRKLEEPIRAAREASELWRFLEPQLPHVRQLYFAGGEPLLHDEHYQLLEKLLAAGRRDVVLGYNSNLSKLRYRHWNITSLWAEFDHVWILASLDGVGPAGELLRKGMRWSETVANFRAIREHAPRVRFGVYPTVNLMNAFHLPTAIDEFIALGMVRGSGDLKVNLLREPRHLNLQILNESERRGLRRLYESYIARFSQDHPAADATLRDEVEAALRMILDSIAPEVWTAERETFRKATFLLDRSRGERFVAHFPHLFDLLYESAAPSSDFPMESLWLLR